MSEIHSKMSHAEIIDDFPELEEADILAALQFAADRERKKQNKKRKKHNKN